MFAPTRIVTRPKDSGLGVHAGIQLFTGQVAHLMPEGVQLCSMEGFSKGRAVTEIKQIDPRHAMEVFARVEASRRSPHAYDLFAHNCEHYAMTMAGESPESPQVKELVGIALVAGLVWAMAAG